MCFFTNVQFDGEKLCANEGQRIDVYRDHNSLNDRFSSVVVPCGLSVHAYADDGFQGWNIVFEGDVADFNKTFNDVISSFEVIQRDNQICYRKGLHW